jgi:drug/metabolite transporter (DMT)-like permease
MNNTTEPGLLNWLEAMLLVLIWTAFLVLARQAVKKDFTPYDMIELRLGFAAIAALLIVAWRRSTGRLAFGGVPWRRMVFVGAFVGLGFTSLAFIAFSKAPAAHGAVLMPGTLPFSTALLAWLVLGEKISGRRIYGLALILLGVCFMAYQAFSGVAHGQSSWVGDLMFPMASSCWAVYVVFSRKWGIKPMDAVVITPLVGFALVTPLYIAFAPKRIGELDPMLVLAHGAFQGWIAFMLSIWLFMRVMQVFGPLKTTMLTAWSPVLAALAAVPVLGEPLSGWVLCGLVAVFLGTVVGVLPQAKPS